MKESGETEWIKKLLRNDTSMGKAEQPLEKMPELHAHTAESKEEHTVKREKRQGGGLADVAGMEWLKNKVKEDFVNVIKYREQADHYHVRPVNILLYGPPGCGKTYFAKKLAEEAGVNFMSVVPDELGSTYIHGSQQKIRAMFDEAAKNAPTIIFLDEIDALLPSRSLDENIHQVNEINEFLALLNESTEKGVYLIGATNNMSRIEGAVLRPGRFDEHIYIGLPDAESREAMFRYHFAKVTVEGDIDYAKLARLTEGFSCSDIDYTIRRATKHVFNQSIRTLEQTGKSEDYPITQELVEHLIGTQHPSVSASEMAEYETMRDRYGFGVPTVTRKPVGFSLHGA